MLILSLCIIASAEELSSHWVAVGPERGHVLDADVSEKEVVVATRVGVMRADPELGLWERDTRFPYDTKRVTLWDDGAWGAPPGQLWVIEGDETTLVKEFKGGIAVDIDSTKDGVVFAAVRGGVPNVYRADSSGDISVVLSDVDPWKVSVHQGVVWVATTNKGLWRSADNGEQFQQLSTGGVTAIGHVGEETWFSLADGSIVSATSGETKVKIQGGFASSIAGTAPNKAFLTVASMRGQAHPLQRLFDQELSPITKMRVDNDSGLMTTTGAWPLINGDVMIGSFRRGPLRYSNQLEPARTGFQATVSRGAATDRWGRMVMALMGTGVYHLENAEFVSNVGNGPVTDAVMVKRIGDNIIVVDFEGILMYLENGSWARMKGVADGIRPQNNVLIDVSRDAQRQWWGIDAEGRLWSRQDGRWLNCGPREGLRLEGEGEHLLLASKPGYRRVSCEDIEPIYPEIDSVKSRSVGGWIASPGALYLNGKKLHSLADSAIEAIALDNDGVLVAQTDVGILSCTDNGCDQVASAPNEWLLNIGRFSNGRIWGLEYRGSMLVVSDAEERSAPPKWSSLEEQGHYEMSLIRYYKNPWLEAGMSTNLAFEVLATAPPNRVKTASGLRPHRGSIPWYWLLICALLGLLLLLRFQYKNVTNYRIDL